MLSESCCSTSWRWSPGPRAGSWASSRSWSREQEAHLVSLVHSGEYSTLEVAELFGIGRSTVYRAIQRQRIAAKTELAYASARR